MAQKLVKIAAFFVKNYKINVKIKAILLNNSENNAFIFVILHIFVSPN